jgi:drug/metabolite transporter (DMT)-like permease
MIPMVLMTVGLEDVPVSIGGLLIALVPLSTILAAHFLVEDERFNPRSVPGLVLSLVGTGVLVGIGGNDVEGVGNLWRGVAYVTAGVILAGLGGALTRRFAQEVPGESLVLPQFAVAAVAMALILPMLPAEGVGGWSGGDWLQVAVIGVVGTALPHAAFLIGASINSAARLALTGYSVPVVAILLAIVMLGERLTPSVGVGAVMIIGGVVLVERSTVHYPEPGFATSR